MIPWGLGFRVDNLFITVHVPTVTPDGRMRLKPSRVTVSMAHGFERLLNAKH